MENHSSTGGKSCFFHINPSNFSSCCNRYFGDIRLKIYKLPIFNPGGGGGYSHTLPVWVRAAQQGRDFEAPDLEWGIHFIGVF